MTTTSRIQFTSRCKAFSGEPMQIYRICVDSDGTVSVWDSVAGHYTTCHALSERQQQRLRKIASEQCEESDIIADGIYEVHPGTEDDLDSYAVVNSQTGAVRADGMTFADACEYADELNAIADSE